MPYFLIGVYRRKAWVLYVHCLFGLRCYCFFLFKSLFLILKHRLLGIIIRFLGLVCHFLEIARKPLERRFQFIEALSNLVKALLDWHI